MTVPRLQESSLITISPYPEIRRYSGFKNYPLAKEWLTSSRVRVTLPGFSPGVPQLRCPRWRWEQLPVETGRGTLQLTPHRSEYWWAFSSQTEGPAVSKLEERSSGFVSGYCGTIPQRPVGLTSRAVIDAPSQVLPVSPFSRRICPLRYSLNGQVVGGRLPFLSSWILSGRRVAKVIFDFF